MSPTLVTPKSFVRVRVDSRHGTDFFFNDLRVEDLPVVRELIGELCKAEEMLEQIKNGQGERR